MSIKIKQTEDTELLEEINKQLKEHNGHCPCQFDDTDPDTKCMCKAFREQIEHKIQGECPCGKFILITNNTK